jgi:hypothetical protein
MQRCESGVSYRRYDGTDNNSQHFEHVDRDRFDNTPDTMEESRRSELYPRKALDVSTTDVVGESGVDVRDSVSVACLSFGWCCHDARPRDRY